ncbi:unnamed protein product [Peronospora belbahrii]|uniref:Uncharacterized protein n=1 Tax=Peronospora belbahrii TaxID=622444 RepID=A0ABN8CNL0_9STRA|nr:unnamed protein product [Peronospora belbahrii]
MKTAQSLLRPSPVRNPQLLNHRRNQEVANDITSNMTMATWTSPRATCTHSSHFHTVKRPTSSYALNQPAAVNDFSLQKPVERVTRVKTHLQTTRATQTSMKETDTGLTDRMGLQPTTGIYLGAFGEVRKMTAETVDFLIHVLEDVGIYVFSFGFSMCEAICSSGVEASAVML